MNPLDRVVEAIARARAPKEPPVPAGPSVVGHEELERPGCPLCENTRAKAVVDAEDTWVESGGRRWSIVRCEICAHRYTTPRYKFEHRNLAFAGAYPFYERARKIRSGEIAPNPDAARPFEGRGERLDQLARPANASTGKGGRLLDVGCGDGQFLSVMNNRDWDVRGVDFDEDVVWHAKNVLKMDAEHLDVETTPLPEGRYDAISMWGVLQLVYKPRRLLENLVEHLEDDGVLALGVSNFRSVGARVFGSRWRGLGVPRHISHFTPETLERLLRSVGLRVVYQHFETPRWIVAGSVEDTVAGPEVLGRAAKAGAYSVGRLVDGSSWSDTIEVYARR